MIIITAKDLASAEYRDELQRLVDKENAKPGRTASPHCPKCKDRKSFFKVVFFEETQSYEIAIAECECKSKREANMLAAEQLGEYRNKTMSDFVANEEWRKDMKDLAIAFLQDGGNKWFFICGQSGCGKSLICSIISNSLITVYHRDLVRISWPEYFGRTKRDSRNEDLSKTVSESLERVKTCEVLYIDELLKNYTEADLRYYSEIIDYRYTNNLKTIINSEMTLDELFAIDESTISKIIEKSDIYVKVIGKDIAKNYRLRKFAK